MQQAVATNEGMDEDGVEAAFDVRVGVVRWWGVEGVRVCRSGVGGWEEG